MLFAGMNTSSAFEWDDHGLNTDLIKEFFISLGRFLTFEVVLSGFCQILYLTLLEEINFLKSR